MSFFLNTTVCGFTLYQILAYFLVYSCPVLDELAGVGEAVLVGGTVLAPRVAEVDVDAADGVLREDDVVDPLDVGAHDLHVVNGAVSRLIGGLHFPLGQDQHLVGDVDAQVIVLRVGAGQLGEETALAAAQLQHERLLRAGILGVPFSAQHKGVVDVEVAGQQLSAGIGLETHSHSNSDSL